MGITREVPRLNWTLPLISSKKKRPMRLRPTIVIAMGEHRFMRDAFPANELESALWT
jgi:hypothetical protein